MLPLSEKLRPKTLSDVSGQTELVQTIDRIIRTGKPLSLLLFGPPGSGKTTLARIYSKSFNLPFVTLSAVFNSAAELKKILKEGHETPLINRKVLIFVDEIHRFNRAQQDLFLPFLEDGSLILVGATTENPSFVLNNALVSRLRPLKLEPLEPEILGEIIDRYEKIERPLNLTEEQREGLIRSSLGDARHLLNLIENLEVGLSIQKRSPLYDKNQDGHFNLISALHKSVRGSDPDASIYYLARMMQAGEDPNYITRRLIRMAVEEVGLADPNALQVALNGAKAYSMLGSPEGDLALAQVVVYLALSPKSIAVHKGYKAAQKTAEDTGHIDPPKHILNAPTKFMKKMGISNEYIYDPETPNGFSGQDYFPKELGRMSFYKPIDRGFERELKKRLEYFSRLRSQGTGSKNESY